VIVHARSEHARGAAAARRLRARARRYLAALGADAAELSILVVTDAAMRRLNRAWRGKDRATDVLSFPAAGPGPLLGDVVISLDTARRAAREEGRALGAELDRYLAHGMLHLLGHDHERAADARRMARAEDALVGEGMVRAAGVARGSSELPRPHEGTPGDAKRRQGRGRRDDGGSPGDDVVVRAGVRGRSGARSGSGSRSSSGSRSRSRSRSSSGSSSGSSSRSRSRSHS
jgi:probable rRNA maturation factor